MRSLALGLAALSLVASPARAEPPSRDVGGGGGTATLGATRLTLSEAEAFVDDPFQPPQPAWRSPLPTAGNLPLQPFRVRLVPELTLRLRPLFGIEPFVRARSLLPLQPGAPVDSDLGFRYHAGRFHAGARFRLVEIDQGLAIDALGYARYVAPTYHVGLADDALIPLSAGGASTHRLTASAGLKPSAAAPSFRVSASVRDAGTKPSVAAGFFGRL
jgi:hypothetical protein